MDSENILNMAFMVEDYQTEYYKMDLQTQHSSEKSEPCMERECIKIQKRTRNLKGIFWKQKIRNTTTRLRSVLFNEKLLF